MKKVFALLAAALLLCCLVSCGKQETAVTEGSETYSDNTTNPAATEPTDTAAVAETAAVEESPAAETAYLQDAIMHVQNCINYNSYSDGQKEYCRGDLFEVDGKRAMVLLYYVCNGAELPAGYYLGLWVENTDGTISCLTDQLLEEAGSPDEVYATVTIRNINEQMHLNPYVRTTGNSMDVSQNKYFLIGKELKLEYDLRSETPIVSMGDGLIQRDDSKSVYYLNQEPIDRSAFYAMQDQLNIGTYTLGIDPNWSEGMPPQGYSFEELLAQLAG